MTTGPCLGLNPLSQVRWGYGERIDDELDATYQNAAQFLRADYHRVEQTLQSAYVSASNSARLDYDGALCIYQAYDLSQRLAPAAILKETGYELGALLKSLLPGLLQMIVVVGATTFLGAAIGGIIGFFAGGVGAAPGAVVGGELGFDLGMAILTWLGLAFLAVSIAKGFVELVGALRNGIQWAWAARELHNAERQRQVERSANELARVAGILMRLILQAIVAYLLKKAAVGSTRGAISTVNGLRSGGAAATAEASVAELVGKLRVSRLGGGFADWVESNWRDLVKDPRLRPKEVPRVEPVRAELSPRKASSPTPARVPTETPTSPPTKYGVYFFGDDVLPYIDRPDATLGRSGQPHFFMPLEDATEINSVGDAARESGMAPSIAKAYTTGGDGFGVSFPTDDMPVRQPTIDDAGGFEHFLEGGQTAVKLPGPEGGYLVNSTREFVTPGGSPMPEGSVLFKLGSNGDWIPIRSW